MNCPGTNIWEWEFPLRPDVVATLFLPTDLTKAEVKRLERFMETLLDESYTQTTERSSDTSAPSDSRSK
jgi:hypothetical protein